MLNIVQSYLSQDGFMDENILIPCRGKDFRDEWKWCDRFNFEEFGVLSTGNGFAVEAGDNVDWSATYVNYSDSIFVCLPICGVISDNALLIHDKYSILAWIKGCDKRSGLGTMVYMQGISSVYISMFKGMNAPCIDTSLQRREGIRVTEKQCLLSDLVDRSELNKYRGKKVVCLGIRGNDDTFVLFIENGESIILHNEEFVKLVRLGLRSVCNLYGLGFRSKGFYFTRLPAGFFFQSDDCLLIRGSGREGCLWLDGYCCCGSNAMEVSENGLPYMYGTEVVKTTRKDCIRRFV